MGNIVLHAFNWKFTEIKEKAEEISALGYSGILISPPALSHGKEWFYRYQPLDYRVIYSSLGNLQELTSAIQALKKNNLKVYIDVVFNHMAHRQDDSLDFPGKETLACYKQDKELSKNRLYGDLSTNLFSASDFNPKKCIDVKDYNNSDKVEDIQREMICDNETKSGLPDLNPDSVRVIFVQREYLIALKELGADGFRIDAAKHMSIEHIKKVFTKNITQGLYVFAEIVPGPQRAILERFLREVKFAAYDFELFYAIRNALSIPGSMENLSNPEQLGRFRSLSFAVTHDIPNNEEMRQLIFDVDDSSRTDEKIAYAYILGRDGGTPLVYSDKGRDDGMFSDYWKDAYKDKELIQMIRFHNLLFEKAMQILSAGKCQFVFSRGGKGVVALNKCAEPIQVEIDSTKIQGKFINLDSSREGITIIGNRYLFDLPARSFQLFLKQE